MYDVTMEERKWGNGYSYDKANPFPIPTYPKKFFFFLYLFIYLFLMERGWIFGMGLMAKEKRENSSLERI